MRTVIHGGTLAALVACAGCSLLTDLQGYSGDEKGNVTPEGADGSALDDATTPPSDGGTDSSSATDAVADGARFCEGQSGKKLCADFDNGLVTGVGSKSLGEGSIVVENGALVVSLPSGTSQATVMTKTFTVSGSTGIVCEFDYQRFTEPSGDGNILAFFKVDVSAPSGTELFELKEELPNAGRLYLGSTFTDGGTPGDYPSFERISKPGKWVRVRGELSFTAQTGKGLRDGTLLSSVMVPTVPGASVTSVTISFGLVPINVPASAWRVAFDNIVCDL